MKNSQVNTLKLRLRNSKLLTIERCDRLNSTPFNLGNKIKQNRQIKRILETSKNKNGGILEAKNKESAEHNSREDSICSFFF